MNTIILIIALLVKKPIDAAYSALAEKIESSHQTPKFKVGNN